MSTVVSTVDLPYRQLIALYRVVKSMNLVGAVISVTPEEMLTRGEMENLQARLEAALNAR